MQQCCVAGRLGRAGAVALTRKLLSLGLVARLRPRRMLSFRSDTLDRVTLPGKKGRSSTCSPSWSRSCPGPLLTHLPQAFPRPGLLPSSQLPGRQGSETLSHLTRSHSKPTAQPPILSPELSLFQPSDCTLTSPLCPTLNTGQFPQGRSLCRNFLPPLTNRHRPGSCSFRTLAHPPNSPSLTGKE
jgi:hypothetical protein